MTDRHNAYIVVLEDNVREDDAELIINALRMVKGVISVTPNISDLMQDTIAESRAESRWLNGLHDFVKQMRSR